MASANIEKIGTLADKNRFDFVQHRLREGEIDEHGNSILSDAEKEKRQNAFRCETVTMIHADGRKVEINAHELDSQAQWRKLGYQTQADIDAPQLATKARILAAADLVEAVRTIQGATAVEPEPKKQRKSTE